MLLPFRIYDEASSTINADPFSLATMKIFLLYLLFFVYTSQLVKPIFPYVKDSLAHIFWYAKHASTVHFENGKYHMHAEAMKEVQATNTDKTVPQNKKATDLSEHINSEVWYRYTIKSFLPSFDSSHNDSILDCFIDKDYLPPRA